MRIVRERMLDPLFGTIVLADNDVLRFSKAELAQLERARALLERVRVRVEERYGEDTDYELVEHAVVAETRLSELIEESRKGKILVRNAR